MTTKKTRKQSLAIRKKPTAEQTRTLRRREKVQYLILTKGYNANQIAADLKVAYSTINSDIGALTEDADFWLNAQVRAGWALQTKQIIDKTFEDIEQINNQLKEIRDTHISEFQFPDNPFDPKTQPDEHLKYTKEMRFAYSAFFKRESHYSDYANLENAKTRKHALVKEFMDDLPLYHKMQNLQRWIDSQRENEVKAPQTN